MFGECLWRKQSKRQQIAHGLELEPDGFEALRKAAVPRGYWQYLEMSCGV